MPRRDPMTGVEVMTMAEFIAKEAEIEGRGNKVIKYWTTGIVDKVILLLGLPNLYNILGR